MNDGAAGVVAVLRRYDGFEVRSSRAHHRSVFALTSIFSAKSPALRPLAFHSATRWVQTSLLARAMSTTRYVTRRAASATRKTGRIR